MTIVQFSQGFFTAFLRLDIFLLIQLNIRQGFLLEFCVDFSYFLSQPSVL